nr:general transcription factor IIH subunit 4-like [Anolis sagrei ordinatus]
MSLAPLPLPWLGHSTCEEKVFVFRELPGLAKNYVMRMLLLEQPLPQAAVASWVKKEYTKEQEESSDILLGLRLWHKQLLPGGLQGIVLNPIFKENLRIALMGGGKPWSDDTSQLGPDKHARDVPSLDKYAEERWEVSFVWIFLPLPILLSFQRKSRRYYPTRLAINLSSGISGTTTNTRNQGFIVVETNYRIYAYTDSELQIALIALFSEMLYRFPNLVVAQVTRESVQQAIANGITADQIIHFLRTRAHPVMLKQVRK